MQRRRSDHVTTIDAFDNQPQRGATTETGSDLDDTADHSDASRECNASTVVNISGKPIDNDVTITPYHHVEEFQRDEVPGSSDLDAGVMQSRERVTSSCRGQTYQTSDFCDRSEADRPADSTESSDANQKLQRKPVSVDRKLLRNTTAGDGKYRPKPSRVCDDCRAGATRASTTSKEKAQRWNSPASQQSTARNQRTTRSTVRPSQISASEETVRRNRSDFSGENNSRSGVANSRNSANYGNERSVNDRQPICSATCSPAAIKHRAADPRISDRRYVTSGHVTRRSLSAKTASNVTQVPGRRCQSSDDRRHRQKDLPAKDHELAQTPFH